MAERILSEVDRDLSHAFKMASRLSYSSNQIPELGKFILGYYIDNLEDIGLKDIDYTEPKEREKYRIEIRQELKNMKLLLIGADCEYGKYFGKVDSVDNFFHMNKATQLLSGSSIPSKLGDDYDLIIADSFATRIPSPTSIITFLNENLEKEHPTDTGIRRYKNRELHDDTLEKFDMFMYFLKEFKNLSDEELDEFLQTTSDTETLVKFDTNKRNKGLIGALAKINTHNYGAEILKNHLVSGGILIDYRNEELERSISEPFGVTLLQYLGKLDIEEDKADDPNKNIYGLEMKLLDKKHFGVHTYEWKHILKRYNSDEH